MRSFCAVPYSTSSPIPTETMLSNPPLDHGWGVSIDGAPVVVVDSWLLVKAPGPVRSWVDFSPKKVLSCTATLLVRFAFRKKSGFLMLARLLMTVLSSITTLELAH